MAVCGLCKYKVFRNVIFIVKISVCNSATNIIFMGPIVNLCIVSYDGRHGGLKTMC